MTEYQSLGFGPLAPVADVVLLSADWETELANVRLHIDTGSDTTLLPAAAVRELGIVPIPGESFAMMAFDGHRSDAPVAGALVPKLGTWERTLPGKFHFAARECETQYRRIRTARREAKLSTAIAFPSPQLGNEGIDRDVGILGRDVLNFFRLGFDGPALAWGELSEFPTTAP